jgi:hypothetical protein
VVTHRYVLSVDLGPAGAFTALAVVERTDVDHPVTDPTYAVKHLRRFPPGTAYGAVADAVDELLGTEALDEAPVVVDVTAVGTEVLDLFRESDARPKLVPVVVTAGHHAEYGPHGAWLVPKKNLVTGLQLLLQGRRLAIPTALPERDLLVRELGNFRAKVSLAANPLEAEWREGQDDDLVLAVALGCWQAGRMPAAVRWVSCAATRPRNPLYPERLFPDPDRRPPWW